MRKLSSTFEDSPKPFVAFYSTLVFYSGLLWLVPSFLPGDILSLNWETMADSEALGMVDPGIFKSLQNTVDKDSSVREKFKDILQTLDKQGMHCVVGMPRRCN